MCIDTNTCHTYLNTLRKLITGGWGGWGGEETKLPVRRIPNNVCIYSALKEVEHNSSLFKYGLCGVTSFQRGELKKWKTRVNLWWRALTNTTLARLSRSTSTVMSLVESRYAWYNAIRRTFSLCGLSLQNPNLKCDHEKRKSDKCQ